MIASEIVQNHADLQGWSDPIKLQLVLDFIDNMAKTHKDIHDSLDYFLADIVDMENDCEDAGIFIK